MTFALLGTVPFVAAMVLGYSAGHRLARRRRAIWALAGLAIVLPLSFQYGLAFSYGILSAFWPGGPQVAADASTPDPRTVTLGLKVLLVVLSATLGVVGYQRGRRAGQVS